MAETVMRLDPVTRFVRELPGDYYLTREAAAELGITADRLKLLGRQHPDTLGPGYVAWLGQLKMFLYDDRDLEQVRAYFAHLEATRPPGRPDPLRYGRGRPPTWTHAEHADRHRRRALARYHRGASDLFAGQGRTEKAERSRARADEIQAGLDTQQRQRAQELTAA